MYKLSTSEGPRSLKCGCQSGNSEKGHAIGGAKFGTSEYKRQASQCGFDTAMFWYNMNMPENTDAIVPVDLQKVPPEAVDPTAIIERLEEQTDDVFRLPGGPELQCLRGFDPQKKLNVSGWSCFLLPGQSVADGTVLYGQNDAPINLQELNAPLAINQIKRVTVHDKDYSLGRDAWGNPSIYAEQKREKSDLEPSFREALKKSIRLWEAATTSEEQVRNVVREELGEDVLLNIDTLLHTLEEYPEIQDHQYWAERIDLWDIAYRGQTVREAKKLLRTKGQRFMTGLEKTPAFQQCERIIEKMVTHRLLSVDERSFIEAIQMNKLAVTQSIRNLGSRRLSDFTHRYAIANIAENLICRNVVGWDIYEKHQDEFVSFAEALKNAGYDVPEWFTPYDGNEFLWSFALDGVIANAGGKYFIDETTSSSSIPHVLDHERVHRAIGCARDLGQDTRFKAEKEGQKFDYERYSESYTDSLALLIKHNGDVGAAIDANAEMGLSYKNGVEQLLLILRDCERESGKPLFGAQLMLDGLKGMSAGQSWSHTDEVRAFYDAHVAKHPGAFDATMDKYQDKNIIRVHWDDAVEQRDVDLSRVRELIKSTLDEVRWEDLDEEEKREYINNEEFFVKQKAWEEEFNNQWITSIVGLDPSPLRARIFRAVQSDGEAAAQLQAYLNAEYLQYLRALKDLAEGGRKKVR